MAIGRPTSGIASKISLLEFTLMHWGTSKGIAGNRGSVAPALLLAVVDVKVLSILKQSIFRS